MRLYAVYHNRYKDRDCIGVFDTYDKAYDCVMKNWENWFEVYDITSFNLNDCHSWGISTDGKTEAV